MSSQPSSNADPSIGSDLPAVSVIVLNYNSREHLDACLQSLQQLIYPQEKLELIVVDNASSDGSAEYVRANYPEVRLIDNDQNDGFGGGNNLGAQQARGELVAFLNPDMRVDPRWTIEAARILIEEDEIAAVGSKILNWDGSRIDFAGGAANFYGYGYQTGAGHEAVNDFDQVRPILFPCGGAMIIRRQLFLEIGGFDEDFFSYYEDLDLGWRLWLFGHKVMFAPASLTYHIHHGSWGKIDEEKRRVLYERNAFFTLLKNYDQTNLNKVLPTALLLLLKRIYLAAGIDERLFRLGTAPQAAGGLPTPTAAPGKASNSTYGPSYYLKQSWRALVTEGFSGLYARVASELSRRAQLRERAQLPGQMQVDEKQPDQAIIPRQALSYVVAGNDIIRLYEKMLQKRAFIQTHRRRSDQEILGLFQRSLDFSERWPEYKQTQTYLTRLFGLDEIFGA